MKKLTKLLSLLMALLMIAGCFGGLTALATEEEPVVEKTEEALVKEEAPEEETLVEESAVEEPVAEASASEELIPELAGLSLDGAEAGTISLYRDVTVEVGDSVTIYKYPSKTNTFILTVGWNGKATKWTSKDKSSAWKGTAPAKITQSLGGIGKVALTITVPSDAPTGTYPLTVSGKFDGKATSKTIDVIIKDPRPAEITVTVADKSVDYSNLINVFKTETYNFDYFEGEYEWKKPVVSNPPTLSWWTDSTGKTSTDRPAGLRYETNPLNGNLTVETNIDAITPAGTYYFTVVRGLESGTQVSSEVCSITVKAAILMAPTVATPTYNGTAQNLLASAGTVSLGSKMMYATGTASAVTSAWSETIPTGTNAGDYYVWYKAYTDATNEKVCTSPLKVTVKPLTATLTWDPTSATYGCDAKTTTATVSNKIGTDTVTVTGYSYADANGAVESMINAGSYTVTATGLSNSNYVLSETAANKSTPFTINKADLEVTLPTLAEDLTYDSDEHDLIESGEEGSIEGADGNEVGTMYYCMQKAALTGFGLPTPPAANDSGWTTDLSKLVAEDAGRYLVFIKVVLSEADSKNYNSSFKPAGSELSSELNTCVYVGAVTISRRQIDIDWSNVSFTYDGKSHLPTAAIRAYTEQANLIHNVIVGDDISVKAKDEDAQVNVNRQVSYMANAELSGADVDNYTIRFNAACDFSILPREITVVASAKNKVYDGTKKAELKKLSLVGEMAEGEELVIDESTLKLEFAQSKPGKNIPVTLDAGEAVFSVKAKSEERDLMFEGATQDEVLFDLLNNYDITFDEDAGVANIYKNVEPKAPDTGDESTPVLWAVMVFVLGGATAVILKKKYN